MLTKAEVQDLRSLQERRGREALGLFLVEGEKTLSEVIGSGFPVERIYSTRPVSPEESAGAPVTEVSGPEMARISGLPTPSPVLAVCRIRRVPLSPGGLDRGLTLALDGVQDPGNVGTLLRIADWYGLDRVVLSPDCADLFSPKVVAASMGSFARVAAHSAALAPALASSQAPVLGCDLKGEDAHSLHPRRDAVIVVGSEGRGLSEEVRRHVTAFVTIPRYGRAESLNAAVAAAVVCDNLRRVSA